MKLLLGLLLLGCSGAPDVPSAQPDAPSSPQQQADLALVNAVAAWTESIGWAPAVATVRFQEPDDDDDRTAGAWSADEATLILVPLRIGSDQARWNAVALHELGHAIGLEHMTGIAIMNPLPEPPACVHRNDAEQVRVALGVDARVTCR